MSPRLLRRPTFALALVLPLELLSAAHAGAWSQSEFVIGTYWDVTVSDETPRYDSATVAVDLARFRRVRAAGFNLLTGLSNYRSCNFGTSTHLADYLLYLAHRTGLRVMVADTLFHRPMRFDPRAAAAVTRHYSARALDAARRAALFGYNVRDEPGPASADPTAGFVKAWVRRLRAADPERMAYLNLLSRPSFPSDSSYERYLDEYLRPSDPVVAPDVASFDQYPFVSGGFGGLAPTYFYSLQAMSARAGGRPLWAYPLVIEHDRYVTPRAPHLRFMAYCPIAYGAKGLIYFTYVRPQCPGNPEGCGPFCDGTALVDRAGEPTAKYAIVASINRYIADVLGPMVMRSTWLGAWHQANRPWSRMRPGWRIDPRTPLVRGLGDDQAMVGVFRDRVEPTTCYLFVVNKSLQPIAAIVTLDGDRAGHVWAAPGESDRGRSETPVSVTRGPTATSAFSVALDGGEGRLFRVTGVAPR